jgi:hypothetical protein
MCCRIWTRSALLTVRTFESCHDFRTRSGKLLILKMSLRGLLAEASQGEVVSARVWARSMGNSTGQSGDDEVTVGGQKGWTTEARSTRRCDRNSPCPPCLRASVVNLSPFSFGRGQRLRHRPGNAPASHLRPASKRIILAPGISATHTALSAPARHPVIPGTERTSLPSGRRYTLPWHGEAQPLRANGLRSIASSLDPVVIFAGRIFSLCRCVRCDLVG